MLAFSTLVYNSGLTWDILQGDDVPCYQLPHVVALCLAEADQAEVPHCLVCKVLIIQLMLLQYVMFGKLSQLQLSGMISCLL